MVGISLYSYLYLKPAKMLCLSFYLLCFLFNKSKNKRVEHVLPGNRVVGAREEGEVTPSMYTHVSKCKNDKIKERK
jgi:hypothetical protein